MDKTIYYYLNKTEMTVHIRTVILGCYTNFGIVLILSESSALM
ncbi:hypothetical protein [Peptostreptococcus porci]|nr:hypothetical protein [Peptostreptococcus porci]MDY5435520.1 hypothetical protein [Peptostreptococcus porci]